LIASFEILMGLMLSGAAVAAAAASVAAAAAASVAAAAASVAAAAASVAVALYVFNITFVTFKYNVFVELLSNDDDIAMSRYVYMNVL